MFHCTTKPDFSHSRSFISMHLVDAFIQSDLYCIEEFFLSDYPFHMLVSTRFHFHFLFLMCNCCALLFELQERCMYKHTCQQKHFSLFYEYLEAVCLQLYALHSSLPSESPFKSYVTDFLRLIFFFFCVCPFYFFHFHILCLFPSVLVLSVLTSSGGSVKLRVVF